MEISNYKKWFIFSYDEFLAANKLNIIQTDADLRYEKITGVVRVKMSEGEYFFFKDSALKIVYISNNDLSDRLWREFQKSWGSDTPERIVRSRAGKTSNQLIFASQGITVSLGKDSVDFIEIYRPCSLQGYLDTVYREPGLFIR